MYFTQNQQVEKYVAERVGQHIIKLALHIRWETKVEAIALCLQSTSHGCCSRITELCSTRRAGAAPEQWKTGSVLRQGWDIQIQDQILHGADGNGNWGYSALRGICTAGYQNGPCFSYFKQSNLSGYAGFVLLIWCWLYHSSVLMQWSFPLSSQITRYNIFFKDMILGSMLVSLHYTVGENIYL